MADPLLRVTRQYVDVLGAGDAKARVTRQYIDVLGYATIHEGQATHTVAFTHQADVEVVSGSDIYEVLAAHTLTLTDVAGGQDSKIVIDMDTLTMTAEASQQSAFARAAVDALAITAEASQQGVLGRSVDDALEVTDAALVRFAVRIWATDVLDAGDQALVDLIRPVVHVLTLTDSAQVDVLRLVIDTLTSDDAAAATGVFGRSAIDTCAITDTGVASAAYGRSTEDALSLTDESIGDGCKVGISTLELSDAAAVEFDRWAEDTLVLVQEVGSNWILLRRRIDTLGLTHAAAAVRVKSGAVIAALTVTDQATADAVRIVVDALALTDEASADRSRLAVDTLVLMDSAEVASNRLLVTDELLGLSGLATVNFIKRVWASSTIRLLDSGRSGIEIGDAADALQETHSEYDDETGEVVPYYIGLQDVAVVAVVRAALYEAGSTLLLSHRALAVAIHPDAIAGDVTDALTLTDANIVEQWPVVRDAYHGSHRLLLDHLAEVVLVRLATDALTLTDAASYTAEWATRAATDALQLGHAVAFVLVAGNVLEKYTPFIGEGDADTPPASCPTPVAGIGECRFCYPVSHPTEFLTLRSPEFGNRDRLQFNRISRETRGGTLIVYADPMWPKIETMALTFSSLSSEQAQDYLDFVCDHLGLEVGFVDWEGFYWKGVILNPQEPTTQDDKTGHTVSFEFECESATWEP